MTTQERLLKELVNCRHFAMGQLMDLAEQEGRMEDAMGWQWLRNHRKYPSACSRLLKKVRTQEWGWSFTRTGIYRGDISVVNRWCRDVREAEMGGGSTLLPYFLLKLGLMKSTPTTEELALSQAASAMGKLLTNIQLEKEKNIVEAVLQSKDR